MSLQRWRDIKWRPLVSYAQHHWALLLSLVGRFATHIIATFRLGYHIQNPVDYIRDVSGFNKKDRRFDPLILIRDIKEFFPNVGAVELREALDFVQRLISARDPLLAWF